MDPDFAAPLADYHLENKFSPCMNAGDPGLALGYEFDIDGQPRISIRVEIGADERKGGILPES